MVLELLITLKFENFIYLGDILNEIESIKSCYLGCSNFRRC
jgi:hypothetical protein